MKIKFLNKMLVVILISAIFYCVYMNATKLREGNTNIATKCSELDNCKSCSTANFTATGGDGVCYWCDNKCVKGADMSSYSSCTRNSSLSTCTAVKPVDTPPPQPSNTPPNYPDMVDIPAGSKMSKQRT